MPVSTGTFTVLVLVLEGVIPWVLGFVAVTVTVTTVMVVVFTGASVASG